MAFLLFSVAPLAGGHRSYTQVGTFSLAGNQSGLILKACRKYLVGEPPIQWTVNNEELLQAGGHDVKNTALVSDIAPNRNEEVNLLEIKKISGFTYEDWTPLMLTMEVLMNDYVSPALVEETKHHFDDRNSTRHVVRTFLYVLGGSEDGGWQFGPVGYVNGALLWPDALQYFLSQMGPPVDFGNRGGPLPAGTGQVH